MKRGDVVGLQITYKELKLVTLEIAPVTAPRLQITYKELKQYAPYSALLNIHCLQVTYKELKL